MQISMNIVSASFTLKSRIEPVSNIKSLYIVKAIPLESVIQIEVSLAKPL